MQAPRTRKMGRSIPEIKQKCKLTVYRYVVLACEETPVWWGEAQSVEEKLVDPTGDVSVRIDASETCCLMYGSWSAPFDQPL